MVTVPSLGGGLEGKNILFFFMLRAAGLPLSTYPGLNRGGASLPGDNSPIPVPGDNSPIPACHYYPFALSCAITRPPIIGDWVRIFNVTT